MADWWSFLDERFRALRGVVSIYDPLPSSSGNDAVRLGGEEDELWISVQIRDGEATERKVHCCLLHEALALTSIVAVADYDAWRNALVSISELGVPPSVDLDAAPRRLQPQFRLELKTKSSDAWTNAQNVIASDLLSGQFQEEYAQVATKLGVTFLDHVSLRVRVFDCCPYDDDRPQQLARLQCMAETIVALQNLEEAIATRLGLPAPDTTTYSDRPVRDRTQYDYSEFTHQLLTALGESRSIKSLKISAGSAHGDPNNFFWLWLGATLFRPYSKCTVEVLDLDMILLSPTAMENLRDAMTKADPLLLIWQRTTQTSVDASITPPPSTHREISVPSGTTVHPYGEAPGTHGDDFILPVDWSVVVVVVDSAKIMADVLLYGIGFCEVERALLSNKRARVENAVAQVKDDATPTGDKLHRLLATVLDNSDPEEPRNHTATGSDALLSLIGCPLTALSLHDSNLNDDGLARCLELCPRLKILNVGSTRLVTMTPIVQTYDHGGLPFDFAEDEDEDDDVLQAWALLVCAMCGRPQRLTQQPIRIDQLVLDTQYNYPEFMLLLLTVVGESRSLKSLKISAGSPRGDPGSFFWLWLGVMLFRADSKCSVEVLNLDMVSLSPLAIDNLRDAITTADPMLLLWQRTTQTSDSEPFSSSIRREITIPSGTTVQPYGDQPGTYLDDFTVPVDWSCIIIVDDRTKSAVDVQLFGVGFYEVERASLSNKRTRVDTTVAMVNDDATTPTEHKSTAYWLACLTVGTLKTQGIKTAVESTRC